MTARQAVRKHCMDCLGAETGYQAYDCTADSALCPLYACHPFRGKLLPASQRPKVGYDEAAEKARLAAHHAKHFRRVPSGSLCTAMCRQCMGVETRQDLPEEQKGGGNRESCGKSSCALWNWQPYKPGGVPKRPMSEKQAANARKLSRSESTDAAPDSTERPKAGVGALAAPVEAEGQVPLAI